MCDPVSLSVAGAAVSAIGTAVSTVDSYEKQRVAAENQRKQYRWQEQTAREQARAQRKQAGAQAGELRRQAARRQGRLRAVAAARGGASGSMLDAMGASARDDEMAARDVLYRGKQQAWGLENRAAGYGFQSGSVASPTLNPFDFASGGLSVARELAGNADPSDVSGSSGAR